MEYPEEMTDQQRTEYLMRQCIALNIYLHQKYTDNMSAGLDVLAGCLMHVGCQLRDTNRFKDILKDMISRVDAVHDEMLKNCLEDMKET